MKLSPRARKLLTGVSLALVAAFVAWSERGDAPQESSRAEAAVERPASLAPASSSRSDRLVVSDVRVESYGKEVFRGDVDLTSTVERIREGRSFPHRNDGAVFQNREGRLPNKPRGYYREYVHPTPGIGGPGPQRIVVGQGGEWYYTADHYGTFLRIPTGRLVMKDRPFCLASTPADLGVAGSFLGILPEGLSTEAELHAALASALRFPGWYGKNWDALADCLRSLSGLGERRVVLFHRGVPSLPPASLNAYLEVLDEAVRSWRHDGEHELVVAFPAPAD